MGGSYGKSILFNIAPMRFGIPLTEIRPYNVEICKSWEVATVEAASDHIRQTYQRMLSARGRPEDHYMRYLDQNGVAQLAPPTMLVKDVPLPRFFTTG